MRFDVHTRRCSEALDIDLRGNSVLEVDSTVLEPMFAVMFGFALDLGKSAKCERGVC